MKLATVFGGTGFVGRQVVRELAKAGYTIKVATRVPERAYFLRPAGVVGQVVPFYCRPGDPESIAQAVAGAEVVVNCIGILFETRKQQFKAVHVDFPAALAAACKRAGVKRFVHISALAVDRGTSKYAATKFEGEHAVMGNFPKATILRPSVIFGPDDNFFNMFARMAMVLPFLPLIGGGKTKFQPVYVGDVADAVMAAATIDAAGPDSPQGRIYELGGPEVVTFREVYELVFRYTHRKTRLVRIPFVAAKIQAFFLSLLPRPLLTCDQVESLKTDNVLTQGAAGFTALGINQPRGMESVLPHYLERYRPGGRFGQSPQNA